MTKRHFVQVADRLRADLDDSKRFDAAEQKRTYDAVLYAATVFADVATRDNARFDRDRFMKAVGL